MKKLLAFGCILLLLIGQFIRSQTITSTSDIAITTQNGKLIQLQNKLTATTWKVNQDSLFGITVSPSTLRSSITSSLAITTNVQRQVSMTLTLRNNSSQKVSVVTTFPIINGLYYQYSTSGNLYYLYPKQGTMHSNADVVHDNVYSSRFPMQFMDVYDVQLGGFYVMTQDTTNYPKAYYLAKSSGKINMKVSFQTKELAPGESWTLPSVVIGAHKNDWHDAFTAYRNWVKSWYQPATPRKDWFRDVYNFRQVFLHTIFGETGAWNPVTKEIDLVSKIEADRKAFGGVDYVHIFDWSTTPAARILDYDPWDYLGGSDRLKNQIQLLQNQNIRVGLYHEGYIMNKQSQVGIANGEIWQQLDTNGNPYDRFGTGNYYPCPLVSGWQSFLGNTVLNSSSLLSANGVYVDQYGFGWQYGCYNPAHNHPVVKGGVGSNLQVWSEAEMLKQIKNKLSPDKVTYIEEVPTDVTSQFLDGSFSYTLQKGRAIGTSNPSNVNLTRFVYPGFKMFEIIKTDRPIGEDTTAIKTIFFNGEGIWLAGPLNDTGWFPESVRRLIRKTHSILSQNKEPFRSDEAEPLVPTLNNNVYSNFFPSERKNIWTLYNAGAIKHSGEILKVLHKPGAVYYDAWNFRVLSPVISGGYASIVLDIPANDLGCVIQSLDPVLLTPPVNPAPVVSQPTVSVLMQTSKLTGSPVTLQVAGGGTGNLMIDWGDGNLASYTISDNVNSPTEIVKNMIVDNAQIKIYVENKYLTYLTCSNNELTRLDVTGAPMLLYLRCFNNTISQLDLSRNYELIMLYCYTNNLTALDVSNNIKLKSLQIQSNKISALNLTGLTNLNSLTARNNPLGCIDLTTNKSIQSLNLRNCQLQTLDLSACYSVNLIEINNSGSTYANRFSACGLDSLYRSLPDRSKTVPGTLKVIYSVANPFYNDGEGSDKTIAVAKNWEVASYVKEVLSGDGQGCPVSGVDENGYIPETILKLSPNPATTKVELEVPESMLNKEMLLVDLTGKIIFKQRLDKVRTAVLTVNYKPGVYIVKVGNNTTRLIII